MSIGIFRHQEVSGLADLAFPWDMPATSVTPEPTPVDPAAAAAAAVNPNLSPAEQVKAYQQIQFLMSQPGKYDYGKGSNRRNEFFRDASMGDNGMSGLYNLHRPTMGAIDINALITDITGGIKEGVTDYQRQNPGSAKIPTISGVKLPSIPIPGILSNIAQSVGAKIKAKPPIKSEAVVPSTVGVSPGDIASGVSGYAPQSPNYLLWGGAALVALLAAKAVSR